MKAARLGLARGMIVLEVVALLGCLLAPSVRRALLGQRAQQIAGEIRIVDDAGRAAHAKTGVWPDDAVAGGVPAALAAYLPRGFRFDRPGYRLDWDQWTVVNGADPLAQPRSYVAVSVTSQDSRLLAMVADRLGASPPHFAVGDRLTVMIVDPAAPAP